MKFLKSMAKFGKFFPDSWAAVSGPVKLNNNDVHVWRDSVVQPRGKVQSFKQILSADEIKRAKRFLFEKDMTRFIVARGLLRTILGLYLKEEPARLSFSVSRHGKPELASTTGDRSIFFNVSHSNELVLIAFARKREIGVDIEYIRSDIAYGKIANRFFSNQENSALNCLPRHTRLKSFYACWTRKEAYLKAEGEGLSRGLDSFNVSVAPDKPAALLNINNDATKASCWSLVDLYPGDGYAAAIAVKGRGWRLKCLRGSETAISG